MEFESVDPHYVHENQFQENRSRCPREEREVPYVGSKGGRRFLHELHTHPATCQTLVRFYPGSLAGIVESHHHTENFPYTAIVDTSGWQLGRTPFGSSFRWAFNRR